MTNQHVMIVEDESIVAMDIQCKLEGLGYSVTAVVQSGEEAIQMAEQVKPDLILMDINLQGKMDGIAAASKILDHADIPVVYLTALRDADTVQRAKRTEPFGYVIKPFNEQELYAAIETSLHKHQVQLQRDRTNLEYTRKALKERTDNLVQRHRELTALNAVFQKHLETQEQEETNHRELQVTVQALLHQIQSLTDELEHRRRVEQKVE